jgi:23S rRNA pseudouridine1911/1915/1917 synthase
MSEISVPEILYEDNHIIVVNKRPSDIVQGDKTGDTPLSEIVKSYIKDKYQKPGNVFCGVVHRLDRPVSGAVIFARTSKALSRLNDMLRKHEIRKIYWAVVEKAPPKDEGTLVNFLRKNPVQNKNYVVKERTKGALRAQLSYKLLASSDKYHLLEVKLKTGRHHQIRVQLAHIGCIIKGDLKYGAKRSNHDASIHLHARKLSLIHPVRKTEIHITAPPPADPLWDYFSKING